MATNFLEATGGSTAGYFSAVTTLMSSEMTGVTTGSVATSASVFTSSGSFGQSIWGEVYIRFLSSATFTPLVGGNIAGWFLRSPDGGTTFELMATSLGLPRPPDFIIPASTIAYASSAVLAASGIVKMPWSPVKVGIQNNLGITFVASGSGYSTLSIGPVAVQY
jgi:hypothetical protein